MSPPTADLVPGYKGITDEGLQNDLLFYIKKMWKLHDIFPVKLLL